MAKYYHFALMTPGKGATPKRAQYAVEATSAPLDTLASFAEIGAGCTFSTRITVAAGHSASVMFTASNWPVICGAAFKVELGAAFEGDRSALGQPVYRVAPGDPDLSIKELVFSCDHTGVLKINGYLLDLSFDLKQMAISNEVQTYRVTVVPLPGKSATIVNSDGSSETITG